jgi:hypothetical protein
VTANGLEHRALDDRAHHVDHLRRRLDTTQRRLADLVTAGQHLEQNLVQILQGRGLNAFHGRDAQHDLIALPLRQVPEHIGSLVVIQVHHDGSHDLRVFVAQQLGHRQRVHPLQAFDARDIAALKNPVQQQRGLVVAQRPLEHGAHIVPRVGHQQAMRRGNIGEPPDHLIDPFARDAPGFGNGFTQLLHLFR